jgi:hypothetical protein
VAIDPDVDNLRARRAYEKAGFRGDTVAESGEVRNEFSGRKPASATAIGAMRTERTDPFRIMIRSTA